jgi:hypothetical protein
MRPVAETVPSASTFDALTKQYISEVLVDSVFSKTPTLDMLKKNTLGFDGRAAEMLVQYQDLASAWYTTSTDFGSTLSGEVATRAQYEITKAAHCLILNRDDVKRQGSQKLASLMDTYVKNATSSMAVLLSTAIYNVVSNAMTPLTRIVDCSYANGGYNGAIGGLNAATATYRAWQSHGMIGTGTFATAVSPSRDNLSALIRTTQNTQGEAVDAIFVAEAYWDILRAQYTSNPYLDAMWSTKGASNASGPNFAFPVFSCDGVPVFSDRYCAGAAWVAAQSTRATAAGYEAFGINFNHLKLLYQKGQFMVWEPNWMLVYNKPYLMVNYLYAWVQLGTDCRRAHFRQSNVDITQTPADFVPGTITIPTAD